MTMKALLQQGYAIVGVSNEFGTGPAGVMRDWIGEAAEKVSSAIFEWGLPYAKAIRQIEQRVLENALARGGQTRREIAASLQTSERTLYHKMRAHRTRAAEICGFWMP